jgi:hypothetical protein
MTRLPRSPGLTLILRLYQETVHDFILLFMPPCGPHLTPLATGSLEQSLLVLSTPGGLTGNDISCLLFTYTNTSQAATCTCNTQPVSPDNVVNHSSHREVTIHRSSNHTGSQTGGAREASPAADAARAQDVVPAADDGIWDDATIRFAPGMPQVWPGGPQRASASSSRQPDSDSFPSQWCTELERPEVPWEMVDRAAAEFNDWRKFFQVGAQVQDLLR